VEEIPLFNINFTFTHLTSLTLITLMKCLCFDSSSFTGTILSNFGLLTSLIDVTLNDNDLTGKLLESFGPFLSFSKLSALFQRFFVLLEVIYH